MRSDRRGFTLIELIVVIVIIGVLAAIAAPMMAGNVAKARKSEAVAAMGSIRTAERLYYVDQNSYLTVAATGWGGAPMSVYIGSGDLTGRYYNANQYSVTNQSGTWYVNFGGVTTDAVTDGAMNMRISDGFVVGY